MPSGQCLSAYSPIFSPQAKVLSPKSNTQGFGGAFGPSDLTISRRIMQNGDAIGAMLERVFANLLTPGEGIESEVEHPGVWRGVRPFRSDHKSTDHAERRCHRGNA